MKVYIFVLWCGLLASAAAFTIPDNSSEYSKVGSSFETAGSQDCKCKNGRCVTDNRGNTKCNCPPGYALQDEFTCEKCNCGKMGRCIFVPQGNQFVKKCICDTGSAEKDGVCIDCHCGEHSKCEFEGEEKVCYCIENFSEKDGVCTECNCGFYGECKFEQGRKKCTCDPGYVEQDGRCKNPCDINNGNCAHMCTLENEQVSCECEEGYTLGEDKKSCFNPCEINNGDCAQICKFEIGEVTCECEAGYTLDDDKKSCKEICDDVHCGEEAKCLFDVERNIPTCVCKMDSLVFDERDKRCKDECHDLSETRSCKNGGHCEKTESGNFCFCRQGTSGSFCEIVDGCDYIDCGGDGVCGFDLEVGNAVCKCKEEDHIFDESEKRCKVKCSEYRRCRNGGLCMEGKCNCRPQTSGHFCEVIEGCDYLCPKQNDINCTYDVEIERPFCKCTEEKLGYDPTIRQCRQTCDEYYSPCVNHGMCEDNGYSRFCECLTGTEGDFCEKVPDCERKDCGSEAECVYDAVRASAACKCRDATMSFDSEDGRCKNTCADSSECNNGGVCEKDEHAQFCRCLYGTSGDYCQEILGCKTKDCGDHAKCVYDKEKQIATCVCDVEGYAFDPVSYKCRATCDGYTRFCLNNGTCERRENSSFCQCSTGTEGDFCENIPQCEEKNCRGESKCAYDVRKKSAFCECHDLSKKYDPLDEKCKTTCNHASCKHRGLCMQMEDNLFCRCKIGTSGELCEIVDECEKGACGDTDATICKYDIERETVECACKDTAAMYDELTKTCRTCDCGKNAISCNFKDGEKRCFCREGFEVEKGICKKKRCLEKTCLNGKCEVVDDREVCSCFEGYELDGNYCKKLNCTNTPCINGTCVVRYGNIEECVCPAGFTLSGGRCTRGLCRPDTCYGGRCETVDGELMCICPDKFHLEGIGCFETVCEIQRCFGGKCIVEDGKEICTCRVGYYLENDVCKKILCEKKNCFGGQCNIVNGEEECTCPEGYSIFEDVCRKD